ncbi:hypothetical protein [Erwinia sp. MYb416]|uniref:hypothetical protein n=1 Tax=Erwinia sp. MYb416 TaxID=3108532 RepID=UPI00309F6D12
MKSLHFFTPESGQSPMPIPLFSEKYPAGFPSSAQDYVDDMLAKLRNVYGDL